jgi:hypothetical protein
MRTLLLLAALVGCETDPPPGPPAHVTLRWVFGDASSVEVRGTVWDARNRHVPAEGTLTYTVFEGPPANGKAVCSARGSLTKPNYKVPPQFEYAFSATINFVAPCPPATPNEIRYGTLSIVTSDGITVTHESDSGTMVPTSLGGSGQLEFPKHYESTMAARRASEGTAAKRATLLRALGELWLLNAKAAPPLGQHCPPLPPKSRVIRAAQEVLAAIGHGGKATGPGLGEVALQALSDDAARALLSFAKGDEKQESIVNPLVNAGVDFVEVVKIDSYREPTIEEHGSHATPGTYKAGIFTGEVWVTELASKKILCRAAIASTETGAVSGKHFEVGVKMDKAFANRVGNEINLAAHAIAPELPNTWP